jgi:VTC domain
MNSSILSVLQKFDTFSLKQLEAANLLERKDFKYIFKASQLQDILAYLAPHYKLLSINNNLYTDYKTDYYDTKNFKFYIQHHNGILNRYKVRMREYVQSSISYFEVKFKNNKNWTSKQRQKINSLQENINNYTSDITSENLELKLKVFYSRITLLSNNGDEKLTFDLNLNFSNTDTVKDFSEICIAEVKSKTHHPYLFRQEVKRLGYREMGLSKYCFGITQLYQHLKNNNFKPAIKNIFKISA